MTMCQNAHRHCDCDDEADCTATREEMRVRIKALQAAIARAAPAQEPQKIGYGSCGASLCGCSYSDIDGVRTERKCGKHEFAAAAGGVPPDLLRECFDFLNDSTVDIGPAEADERVTELLDRLTAHFYPAEAIQGDAAKQEDGE